MSASNEISPELVERMVALVRDLAGVASRVTDVGDGKDTMPTGSIPRQLVEATAIAALLPKPVDPDLIEARNMAASKSNDPDYKEAVLAGLYDERLSVENYYEGIKRGRELAGEGK